MDLMGQLWLMAKLAAERLILSSDLVHPWNTCTAKEEQKKFIWKVVLFQDALITYSTISKKIQIRPNFE